MKIAQIVCAYPPYGGGMGAVAFELTERLIERGHDVTVFTPQRPHPTREEKNHIKRLAPLLRFGNAAYLPQIKKRLEEVDLVHLHYPFFGTAHLVEQWKKKHPQIPLVLTYHMDNRAGGWKGLLFDAYSAWWLPSILRVSDALIASSFDYLAVSDARHSYRDRSSAWHEIPFGVDTERFVPREKPDALFARYGLVRDMPTVLFVGGMDAPHYFKGVRVLLQALAVVQKRGIRCQAVFVGDGELREGYMAYAKGLGVESMVRFPGYVSFEELPFHYAMADVMVLPSIHRGEAFGMVLLEAMASGVPVIASDLPGVRTVAHKGGIVVPPHSVSDLAHALIATLADRTVSLPSASVLRERVMKEYSWSSVVSAHEALYQTLVA